MDDHKAKQLEKVRNKVSSELDNWLAHKANKLSEQFGPQQATALLISALGERLFSTMGHLAEYAGVEYRYNEEAFFNKLQQATALLKVLLEVEQRTIAKLAANKPEELN